MELNNACNVINRQNDFTINETVTAGEFRVFYGDEAFLINETTVRLVAYLFIDMESALFNREQSLNEGETHKAWQWMEDARWTLLEIIETLRETSF